MRACTCAVYLVGGGLIIEANIPVQELEGQRGEGAYYRRGLILGRIRYSNYEVSVGNLPGRSFTYKRDTSRAEREAENNLC